MNYEEERKVAPVEQMEGFYGHLGEVLDLIEFIEEENPARMMNAMRRIFSRRLPDERDVRILRGFLSKIERKVKESKGLRGGVPAVRRTSKPEVRRRDCGKGPFQDGN